MALTLALAADIQTGPGSSFPGTVAGDITVFFGELYFAANNGTIGSELYKYDPVTREASLVANINPDGNPSTPTDFAALNGLLYFAATDGTNGRELYVYDPETELVTLAANIAPAAANSFPSDLTVLNGLLYFAANDGTNGDELYVYNPETNVATLAANINQTGGGANSSFPSDLTVLDGLLYFAANDGVNGNELFVYDPETNAATLAANIRGGANSSNPSDFAVFNGLLYFAANNGVDGNELYVYNPDTQTASLASNINLMGGGANSSNPSDLTVFNGELYFAANDGVIGTELFRFNFETNETTLVADIREGGFASSPNNLTVFEGELYFFAVTENGANREVFKYNPDTDQVTQVANINQSGGSNPLGLTVLNGELFLSADDGTGTTGQELYSLTPDPFDGRFGEAQVADIGGEGESNFTVNSGGWTSLGEFPRTLADVNGDGLADIVGFGNESVFVSLSEGDGSFGEVQNVLDAFTPVNGGWTSQNQFPRTAGDINGDGRADLVGFGADSVFVSLSQEDGTFSEIQVADIGGEGQSNFTVNNGGWTSQDEFPRMLGDFNGDGNYDIIGFGNESVFVSLSEGDGSFGEVQSVLDSFTVNSGGWTSQGEFPRMVGDFNGDGRDDIIGFGANDVLISFSNADGTFSNPGVAAIGEDGASNFTVNSGGWTSQGEFPRVVADINGDNRDDIVGFGQDEIFYALSEGDGSFTESEILSLDGARNFTVGAGGWTSLGQFPRFLDDINGDDKADIVGFGSESVFAALA